MSMMRKLMRSVTRSHGNRFLMNGTVSIGTTRAGMHQKSEHDFQRAAFMENEYHEESVDEALEIPEEMAEEIPPEELTESAGEAAAEEVAAVEPDEEILGDVSDPDEADEGSSRLSVDYSAERIPVASPQTGGVNCEPRELVYDPGDGTPKEIELPPVIRAAVAPFFPEVDDPSANVPEIPEA